MLTGHALAGFLSRYTLNSNELGVLRVATAARMAQSLSLGAFAYSKQPVANEYLLTTAKGWPKLRDFWKMSNTEVLECWKSIWDSYGVDIPSDTKLL